MRGTLEAYFEYIPELHTKFAGDIKITGSDRPGNSRL